MIRSLISSTPSRLLSWAGATALALGASLASANYTQHPGAAAVMDELIATEGFERAELERVFASAERQQSIIDAMSRPAEKSKPWYEYRKIFLTPERLKAGVAFHAEHAEALARAEQEMGVPVEMILAIIGVETYYGRITGSYRVVDALSTLAFDYPRRSEYFTKELKNYLILTRQQAVDPLAFKGSYAGAMGYGQFMPSSYLSYAIDFDDDGKIDIWNNPTDAIGSVANYFKAHGWTPGGPVVVPARVAQDVDRDYINGGLKPKYNLEQLSAAGIATAADLPSTTLATAREFEVEDGTEYWLGLHNFYVITRYNHSSMYAMAVYQFSQNLAEAIAP